MNDPTQTVREALEQELARQSTSVEHFDTVRLYRKLIQWWADRETFARNKELQNGYETNQRKI